MEHETIIRQLGGPAALARSLGFPTVRCDRWMRRNRIPPQYWPNVIAAAKRAKVRGIDAESLVAGHPARNDNRIPAVAAAQPLSKAS